VRFKRETGKTLHDELVRSRVAFACGLLRDGDATIDSIAAAAGFSSAQRFYAVFKERTGRSPGEYRNDKGQR
jgi:AraC-like DNA-binding protein